MKTAHAILILAAALLAMAWGCAGDPRRAENAGRDSIPAPWDLVEEGGQPIYADEQQSEPEFIAEADSVEESLLRLPDSIAKPDPRRMSRYNRVGRLNELFNDSNRYQYAVASRIGITPIRSITEAYYLRRPLKEISSCRWYDLDTLTHSIPFLVPEAASLLETIGRNFADSLAKHDAPGHKFRVTSVLRTAHSVKRLRRVNRNATDSSTHQFGTTFDISYSKFNHYGGTRLSDEELKYILAEVLRDLRLQNKCMVKYERKSPCFHITATGR